MKVIEILWNPDKNINQLIILISLLWLAGRMSNIFNYGMTKAHNKIWKQLVA